MIGLPIVDSTMRLENPLALECARRVSSFETAQNIGMMRAGHHEAVFPAVHLPSGLYYCWITAGGRDQAK